MSTEFKDMSTATPFDKLKCALIGKEKSGKSRLAATGRKPVVVLDFDQRSESIAGINGVYSITFRDPTEGYVQPSAFNEMLEVLSKIEKEATLQDIGFKNAPNGVKVKTLVTDSCQTIAKAAMRFALYSSKEIRKEINIGGKMVVQVPNSFTGWNIEMDMVEQVLLRMLAIPEVDIIWTFHETAEEAPESTSESPRYTGKIDVFPVRHKRLLKYYNEVWRLERDGITIPQVRTVPSYQFTAATCLQIDGMEKPNIEEMIAKHITKTGQTSKLLEGKK